MRLNISQEISDLIIDLSESTEEVLIEVETSTVPRDSHLCIISSEGSLVIQSEKLSDSLYRFIVNSLSNDFSGLARFSFLDVEGRSLLRSNEFFLTVRVPPRLSSLVGTGTGTGDGFSPIANVTKSGRVATIRITDKSGTTTATVSDGKSITNAALDESGHLLLQIQE